MSNITLKQVDIKLKISDDTLKWRRNHYYENFPSPAFIKGKVFYYDEKVIDQYILDNPFEVRPRGYRVETVNQVDLLMCNWFISGKFDRLELRIQYLIRMWRAANRKPKTNRVCFEGEW